MNNDFNPFDLSAPPPKPAEEQKPPEPEAPKPTVRRISMGPLFHSRITKVLALVLGLVLFFLIGYSGTSYLLNERTEKTITPVRVTDATPETTDAAIDSKALEDAAQTVPTTPETPAATPAAPTAPAASAPAAKTYCGVSGMPEGACTAITSIEKDGIKNNKYVSADTTQLPDGATTEIDEKSWMQPGPELGNVSFTGKYANKSYAGKAFMQISDGMWKVISYTLNQ